MKRTTAFVLSGKGRLSCAALVVVALCFAVLPVGTAPASQTDGGCKRIGKGATFDLYSVFPEQMLSPMTGKTKTFMPLETRNIADCKGCPVSLSTYSESRYFKASVDPARVNPQGKTGVVKSRVNVECNPGTPDNTIGWIKVTGSRGKEKHRIWLKATALASQPKLEKSRGTWFTGQGYTDAELQPFTSKPCSWHISAKNMGGDEDTFSLGYRADKPCQVTYRDIRGKKVNRVMAKGRSRNLLFSKPVELTVEVVPISELPKDKPQKVTLILGPGKHTAQTSELNVQVINPGMLFCVNDLAGVRPHPHQVMAGETTSFMFHVSNLDKRTADFKLAALSAGGGWKATLDRDTIKSLPAGKTAEATLTVTAPASARAGDGLNITASAESSTGRQETSNVAAQVTNARNIYYWSIDSMDPEYLYLDRNGSKQGSEGNWLMPNAQAFIKESTNYTNADVYLPSATDMNHTNALAGTYTGTMGVYMVGGTFKGFTNHDEVLSGPNTMDLMRYGPDGKAIERAYEVAKTNTGGKALCGFWSNKNWLADFEGERSVDIVGHSERWPLFFKPPYKYRAAGDPVTDQDPKEDRLSVSVRSCFHGSNPQAVIIATLLGQFDLFFGARLLSIPLSLMFGKTPGMHAEDRYVTDSFFRSIKEEDPDVSYVNIGDLDNTGHFTGSSWALDQWGSNNRKNPSWEDNKYSPWMRRDDALDMCKEADVLFGDFVKLLKERGVYQNSTIIFLSDHGMENMKDPKKGYQVIDLRDILRENGYVRHEDYEEVGGTELNLLWCNDAKKASEIKRILEQYTVNDPELGPVRPLNIINRQEMKNGKDFGKAGKVRPGELYSEYWIDHPSQSGEIWPDFFAFPLYNYQVLAHGDALASGINNVGLGFGINVPEQVKFGLPGAHGGLQTVHMPLIFKAPAGTSGYPKGSQYKGGVEVGDITPTIYRLMGWESPPCVDGKPLPSP